MNKFLVTSVVLTLLASPAFAQSFDPDNGTGNVLSFGVQSILPQNDSEIRAYGMVPRARSAHAMRRHKESAASSGNCGFGLRNGAVPEVNDPVGLVSPQADFSGG